jgi:hypothetical protein
VPNGDSRVAQNQGPMKRDRRLIPDREKAFFYLVMLGAMLVVVEGVSWIAVSVVSNKMAGVGGGASCPDEATNRSRNGGLFG